MLNERAMDDELFYMEWLIDESILVLQPGPLLNIGST